MLSVTDVPATITNRIFSVKLSLATLETGVVPVRAVLIAGDAQVGSVGMAVGAEYDRAAGTVGLVQGSEATVGFVLDDDAADSVKIVVLDPATDAEMYRSPIAIAGSAWSCLMSVIWTEVPPRDDLDDKVNEAFAGKVVRKDLVRKVKVGANVPVFVLEFLLGKYCASSDPVAIEMGLQVVNDTLANNYIRPDESMKAQSLVIDQGRHTFIDKVKVRVADSERWAEAVNFGDRYLHVPSHYVRDYERLLTGGVWAQVEVKHEYDDETRGKRSFWITKLEPIQIATFDLGEYRAGRQAFTTDEWIDFLVRSMGYESAEMDRRLKLLFLMRLVPLAERNYNLVELGPRGTGKSYAVQEVSPYSSLLTGPTTVANLFGHMSGRQKGDGADLGCGRLRRGS